MKNNRILFVLAAFAFSSCMTENNYYLSPSDIRTTPYVTLPMVQDPEKTVTTASLGFNVGGSNKNQRDQLTGGTFSVMQSHHFGYFQAYYGAAFGAGKYAGVDGYSSPYYPGRPDTLGEYHVASFDKKYGYYGLNGGINVVVPFSGGHGEWRALGLDLGYRREFGSYLDFRRQLPAKQIDLIALYDHEFSIGGSTEILMRTPRGTQVSYKIAAGGLVFPHGQYTGQSSGSKPYYFCQTFAVTKHRVTGFMQVSFGTYANQFQTGLNVNLRQRNTVFPHFERRRRDRPERVDRRRPPRPFERRRNDQ